MESTAGKGKLTMVACRSCGANVFISDQLPPLHTTPCSRCQAEVMMPMMLRQYRLVQPIASGGMGTVYRATDTWLDREVAVKLLNDDLLSDEEVVESFVLEGKVCASLNHANIIQIYTFERDERVMYLAMELADKGSLDSRIEAEGALPELDVLDMGTRLASALESALKKDVLHRDIKPGNILFNQEGEPKLVDFGLAVKTSSDTNYHGVIWGTPFYIAPEKVNREPETFHSDMYSLAGTLYHALTGQVPFDAPSVEEVVAAQIHVPLTPPNHVVSSITQNTSNAIYRAMAKRPEDRFSSYSEFIMALESARSQLLVGLYGS